MLNRYLGLDETRMLNGSIKENGDEWRLGGYLISASLTSTFVKPIMVTVRKTLRITLEPLSQLRSLFFNLGVR